MNGFPLVSICIPAYNHAHLLNICIESIINQSYQNFEIIVTDDSEHNELELLTNSFFDNRIKYFRNLLQLGSPANWNECIKHAKGDLIKIMHHDDWFVSTNCLQQFVDVFVKNPNIDFAFSQCYNVSTNKTTLYAQPDYLISKIFKNPFLLLFGNIIGAPSTTIFTSNVAKQIQFNEKSSWYVDVIFYIYVIDNFKNFKYINSPLINITTDSDFQVTNTTSGLKKVREAIFTFNLFNNVYLKYKMLFFIQFIELFNRYNIQSLDLLDAGKPFSKFKTAFLISKLPINYRFYALVRRLSIKFLIN